MRSCLAKTRHKRDLNALSIARELDDDSQYACILAIAALALPLRPVFFTPAPVALPLGAAVLEVAGAIVMFATIISLRQSCPEQRMNEK